MATAYPRAQRRRFLAELAVRRAAGESLDAICATPGWPSRPTLRKWLARAPRAARKVPALRRARVRWSPELGEEICAGIWLGHSLRQLSLQPGMPDRKTLDAWRRRHPRFAADLDAARAESGQPRTGRRTTYDPVLAQRLCLDLCFLGALTRVCAQPGLPAPRTVRDWAKTRPELARSLALARQSYWDTVGDRRMAACGLSHARLQLWANQPAAAAEDGGEAPSLP